MSQESLEFTAQLEAYRDHYQPFVEIVTEDLTESIEAQTALAGFARTLELRAQMEAKEKRNFDIVYATITVLPDPKHPASLTEAKLVQAHTVWSYDAKRHKTDGSLDNGGPYYPLYIVGQHNRGRTTSLILAEQLDVGNFYKVSFKTKETDRILGKARAKARIPYTESELDDMIMPWGICLGTVRTTQNCVQISNKPTSRSAKRMTPPQAENEMYILEGSTTERRRISDEDMDEYDVINHCATLAAEFKKTKDVIAAIAT